VEYARFGGLVARDPVEVRATLEGLDEGFWAVVADFEGPLTAVRFADVQPVVVAATPHLGRPDPRPS
jgi:para-aminobenzoate synthetase component I